VLSKMFVKKNRLVILSFAEVHFEVLCWENLFGCPSVAFGSCFTMKFGNEFKKMRHELIF
jgi:hypothetical protein